jgi:ABC-type multidrug transport system fused ATPase/permease subunit
MLKNIKKEVKLLNKLIECKNNLQGNASKYINRVINSALLLSITFFCLSVKTPSYLFISVCIFTILSISSIIFFTKKKGKVYNKEGWIDLNKRKISNKFNEYEIYNKEEMKNIIEIYDQLSQNSKNYFINNSMIELKNRKDIFIKKELFLQYYRDNRKEENNFKLLINSIKVANEILNEEEISYTVYYLVDSYLTNLSKKDFFDTKEELINIIEEYIVDTTNQNNLAILIEQYLKKFNTKKILKNKFQELRKEKEKDFSKVALKSSENFLLKKKIK